jgi:hypothetical protein
MSDIYKITSSFTLDQVLAFAQITDDNGPVHTDVGAVQGGYILSLLPKWLKACGLERAIIERNRTVSVALDVTFRNKLLYNTEFTVEFIIARRGKKINKLHWKIYDGQTEYCYGSWTLCAIDIE